MVGIAFAMLAMVITGLVLLWRNQLDYTSWYLRLCEFTVCLGFIAVICGWVTTEVGRQPWTIYGLMRTADSVSPSLTGGNVLLSLLLYVAVYLMIYPVGVATMLRIVRRGPAAAEEGLPVQSGHPKSPIEALGGTTIPEEEGAR
jgi:cytochrome d ubiquinol oxidase subunit I